LNETTRCDKKGRGEKTVLSFVNLPSSIVWRWDMTASSATLMVFTQLTAKLYREPALPWPQRANSVWLFPRPQAHGTYTKRGAQDREVLPDMFETPDAVCQVSRGRQRTACANSLEIFRFRNSCPIE